MPDKARPRWYFSMRSPYSWLAHHDLTEHFPDVLETVELIACWEPDQPMTERLDAAGVKALYTPMSRAKHFYILHDVRRLAAARGLKVTWPVDRDPTWDVTNLAYLMADQAGKGREFLAACYRKRWAENKVIWDRAVVAEIAGELGLDPVAAASAADNPELQQRGVEHMARADKEGVFGVPYFVHGRETFWGLDRLSSFVAAVRGKPVRDYPDYAWRAGVEETDLWVRAGGDGGHAGGCG
ncbi:hypothetical protein BS329_20505 [Amycolatopsis coloradensis]|uniref:2-hydroxychromene-2-carboxylate isomerase n=1 Tax=Amycolatopsis coloradensis TaxID=76021 RepID=A0A1R0KQQ1_9PSEU|nr:DsbA family protein [Amycolatopsis coloradensis]OLZ50015.1 hypothetical protein BS329_20505 [Amycolatopsis coloradensis]